MCVSGGGERRRVFDSTAAAFFFYCSCRLAAVAAPLLRRLWATAMTLRVVARTRLLLVFGCVFFAVFKPSGVPPPGAESGYLPCMQQSVPPERYLDDWGDHLFNHTFTRLTQRLRLGALLHPATLRGQLHAIQKSCCPSGLVQQLRNISTVSCKGDGNCGWHSLLNGNCRFLGQVGAPLTLFIHCAHIYSNTRSWCTTNTVHTLRRYLL